MVIPTPEGVGGKSGKKAVIDNVRNTKVINNDGSVAPYKIARLKRDRPELAEKKEPYNSNRYKPII